MTAVLLFVMSGGGTQLADALVFHRHPMPADVPRVNAVDHCHAENCDLGAPICPAPPPPLRAYQGRLAPCSTQPATLVPADAPRSPLLAGPLGSRAPPFRS